MVDRDLKEIRTLLQLRGNGILENASHIGPLASDEELKKTIELISVELSNKFEWLQVSTAK